MRDRGAWSWRLRGPLCKRWRDQEESVSGLVRQQLGGLMTSRSGRSGYKGRRALRWDRQHALARFTVSFTGGLCSRFAVPRPAFNVGRVSHTHLKVEVLKSCSRRLYYIHHIILLCRLYTLLLPTLKYQLWSTNLHYPIYSLTICLLSLHPGCYPADRRAESQERPLPCSSSWA